MPKNPVTQTEPSRVFLDEALFTLPRLLTLTNQNEASSLYGCIDRNYWNYKNIDFACGRLQESCLSYALFYSHPFNGHNPFYRTRKMGQLAKSTTLFLSRMQRGDGTFDQFWPYEVSSAASMFPAYCLATAYDETKNIYSSREAAEVEESLHRSFKLGERLEETDFGARGALNQEMGAICSMFTIKEVLGKPYSNNDLINRLHRLLDFQTTEGWFPEFYGADAGYSFVTLDYMMKIYKHVEDEKLLESSKKLISFLKYMTHPNGTVGGEYASRYTEWVAPHGIALLSNHSPDALAVLRTYAEGLQNGHNIGLRYLDDRYLCYEHYTYTQAALVNPTPTFSPSTMPFEEQTQHRIFPEAGLTSVTHSNYYLIYSQGKGGVFRIYDRETGDMLINDTGLIVRDSKGNTLVSGWLQNHMDLDSTLDVESDKVRITSVGTLVKYKDTRPKSMHMILSRIGMNTISFSFWMRRKVLEVLRGMLITKRPKTRGEVRRELILAPPHLTITDTVKPFQEGKDFVQSTNRTTDRYITSKQFGQFQDLTNIAPISTELTVSDGEATLTRKYNLNSRIPQKGYILEEKK